MADTEDHLLPMVMDEQLDADTDNKDPLLSMTMNQQSNKLLSGSNTEQNSGEASSVCILLENNTEIHQMFSVHSFRKQHREKQHLDTWTSEHMALDTWPEPVYVSRLSSEFSSA